MTSRCPTCNMPAVSTTGHCNFCGAGLSIGNQNSGGGYHQPSISSFQPRSSKDTLLSHLIDLALLYLTLGIGWLIWSVVLSFAGQSPANKLRDELVLNIRNSRKAPAWKLIVRSVVTVIFASYIPLGILFGFSTLLDVGGYYFATIALPLAISILILIDLALIFTPIRRRLIDWLLAIKIADGNGYSFRNYKSPERPSL